METPRGEGSGKEFGAKYSDVERERERERDRERERERGGIQCSSGMVGGVCELTKKRRQSFRPPSVRTQRMPIRR